MSPDERELWVAACLSVLRGKFDGPSDSIVASAIRAADKVVEAYRKTNTTWIGPRPGEVVEVSGRCFP